MATTLQIKSQIASKFNITPDTMMFTRQFEQVAAGEAPKPSPWISYWNNEQRFRVAMHDDVAKQIKANPTIDTLAYKVETVPATASREAYTRFVLIIPTNVELTF